LILSCDLGWRYRKRLTVFPALSLNLGKSGLTSVSVGTRGAHYTIGRRGQRATIGLPGTGLSYTMTPHRRARRRAVARHGSIAGGLVVLFLFYLLIRALAGV
jgi:hypothetical protein